MNWDAIAAVAEIVAASGVIISVTYLSRQIRSSTEVSRETAAQEILNGNRFFLAQLGRDAATAGVWRRGIAADPTLTVDEVAQFHALLLQAVLDWQRVFYMGLAGGLARWAVDGNTVARREIVSAAGFKKWYPLRKHWLSAEFQNAIERDMTLGKSHAPLGVSQSERSLEDREPD